MLRLNFIWTARARVGTGHCEFCRCRTLHF